MVVENVISTIFNIIICIQIVALCVCAANKKT